MSSSHDDFATGGYIPGPGSGTPLIVQLLDLAPCGFPLFRINGGPPEHIISKADIDSGEFCRADHG